MIGLLLLACAPAPGVLGTQPPIQTFLVVHVDPLPRISSGEPCADPGLSACGRLSASAWRDRTDNLSWLAETWLLAGRTMDLELGPEASLGWAEDPEVAGALAADLASGGESDAAEVVAAVAAQGREAIAGLVEGGAATLGVHVHAALPDAAEGRWGEVDTTSFGGPHPCAAWAGDPLQEAPAARVGAVVGLGARAADGIAAPLGASLDSFTGHLPRSMAGKIAVVEDPAALDTESELQFPDLFSPYALGSAYAECLTQAVDQPPMEAWPADAERALGAGDGPLVVPGARVIGSMAEHLGAPSDASLDAAARRLLVALLEWRFAGLSGAGPRPWVHTFHAHLFDLYAGSPNPLVEGARDVAPVSGSPFRGEVETFAGLLDAFAGQGAWQGVASDSGGVVRWGLPRDLDGEGAAFSYGAPDQAPPETYESDQYPYLNLVAERLADTHLVCVGARDGVEIYGLLRCSEGWGWGAGEGGYGCAGGGAPVWVYALVPDGDACLAVPDAALSAGAVDDAALEGARWCARGGLSVPVQGLIVEPVDGGAWLVDDCGPWG